MAPFLRGLVVGGVCATALGCGFGREVPKPVDPLATWSRVPLPADPALAALATAPGSACSGMVEGKSIRVLLQDRRTAQTAAFLVDGPELFGGCLVSAGGGGSSGGYGPPLTPMTAALTIDEQASGTIGEATANTLGGRVVGAPSVIVELRDGTSVTASFAGSYWLAWWPGDVEARQVVARDGTGALVATLEVPTMHPAPGK